MKKAALLFFLMCSTMFFGQVGIGTTLPDPSTQLDVVASNKGILIPRVNIEDLNTAAPVSDQDIKESVLVYNTNTTSGKGFYYWMGDRWERISNTQEVTTLINSISDDQQLTSVELVGNVLSITLENGGTKSVDLASLAGNSAYQAWLDAGNTGTVADFLASLKGVKGDAGTNGVDGDSAYQAWLDAGNTGTATDFLASIKGDAGTNGVDGDSAYQAWLDAGNTGTATDFLASIKGDAGTNGADGDSAYQAWLDAGNTGTVTDFLASIKGDAGNNGVDGDSAYQAWLDAGNTGTVADFLASIKGDAGNNGVDGDSAYQAWLDAGNTGTVVDFLASLKGVKGDAGTNGVDGDSAYQAWLDAGNTGTVADFLASLKGVKGDAGSNGVDGDSAYQAWLDAGNTGTEADFLASLKGAKGDAGNNGVDGDSAYQAWLDAGNTGTEADFLVSLKGAKGDAGNNGVDGDSAYQAWLDAGNTGTEADFLASLKGAKGDAGSNGVDAIALTGSGSPTNGDGVAGNIYINIDNGDVYTATGNPTVWNQTTGLSDSLSSTNGLYTHTDVDGNAVTFNVTQTGAGTPAVAGVTGVAGDVYVDTVTGNVYTYNSTDNDWVLVAGNNLDWSLTGNAGTNEATNFIGTTDNRSFNFRVNNTKAGHISFNRENTALGLESGSSLSTGSFNAFFGNHSGKSTTTGIYNVAIGSHALSNNITDSQNVAIGYNSMLSLGTVINPPGDQSRQNTAIGGRSLIGLTRGSQNLAIGTNTLANLEAGYNNMAIGSNAGSNLERGSFNILIGYDVGVSANLGSNQMSIGNLIYGTDIDGTDATISSGNIGIGVKAPTEKLDVGGKARVRTLDTAADINVIMAADADGVLNKTTTTVAALKGAVEFSPVDVNATGSNNSLILNKKSDGTARDTYTDFGVTDKGGIFIGDASDPDMPIWPALSIYKPASNITPYPQTKMYMENKRTDEITELMFRNDLSRTAHFSIYPSDSYSTHQNNALVMGTSAPNGMIFGSPGDYKFFKNRNDVNDELMRLQVSSGNLGIGTTTPTEKLEVNGTIKATKINFTGLPSYADDAAADADVALESGSLYRVGRIIHIKL